MSGECLEESPEEGTVPGEDQPVAVDALASVAGELGVHQIVAGLLGGQLGVEVFLVSVDVTPDQSHRPPGGQVHGGRGEAGDAPDQTVLTGLTTVPSISNTLYLSRHQHHTHHHHCNNTLNQ